MAMSSMRLSSERGAVLIHVAIALLGLLAFTTFVVDYGIMWVSRGQAQTSADAGALSGAIALAFEGAADFNGARAKAKAVAVANRVWGQPPDVQIAGAPFDVTFPPCPPGAPGLPDTCVKVDVFRNLARGNPLPVLFGGLVGVDDHGVRATATAQIVTGDTTDCLKPWAVVDRWEEAGEPFSAISTYDKYSDGKNNKPPYEPDNYRPPTPDTVGTGFRLPEDEGLRFAIKTGPQDGTAVSSGWFKSLDLPRADTTNLGGGVLPDEYFELQRRARELRLTEYSLPHEHSEQLGGHCVLGCARVLSSSTGCGLHIEFNRTTRRERFWCFVRRWSWDRGQ